MNHIERFWSKVDQSGDCWEWLGARRHAGGYGAFWNGTKVVLAHRFIYEAEFGPIPEALVVDHICRNTQCVRPSHLRAASRKQNNENRGAVSVRSSSGYRGVSWDKSKNKWMAHLTHDYKFRFVGYFDSAEDAAEAAAASRAEVFTHSAEGGVLS